VPWDLSRKNYGLFILPPFYKQDSVLMKSGENKIDILHGIMHYIKRSRQKYVLLAESNVICNLTFDKMMELHQNSNADITIVSTDLKENEGHNDNEIYVNTDENNMVTEFQPYSSHATANKKSLGFYLLDCNLLENIVENCVLRGDEDFTRDALMKNVKSLKIMAYNYDGYNKTINDINSFYEFNMELLQPEVRQNLFESENKILTKVKDKVPARYLKNADVRNSFIADGCIIDGEVENCVLFRGVEIRKGSSIKNCVIMQDSKIFEKLQFELCHT
jgi:glucose-1-phosphate adenylyltransferase, GlgD subunit